jgi:hypothetical protein
MQTSNMNGTQVFKKPATLWKEKKNYYAYVAHIYKKDITKAMHDRHMKQTDVPKLIHTASDFVNIPKILGYR